MFFNNGVKERKNEKERGKREEERIKKERKKIVNKNPLEIRGRDRD